MITRTVIALFVATVAVDGIVYLLHDLSDLPVYYAEHLRASLFTGFLTVGSFLLSLNTLVVVRLKENVFDSEDYRARVERARKLKPELTRYGPVKRLNRLLFASICATLTASVAQLTIGLVMCWIATLVCIFLAAFALCMLIMTLFLIRKILDVWLDHAEKCNG